VLVTPFRETDVIQVLNKIGPFGSLADLQSGLPEEALTFVAFLDEFIAAVWALHGEQMAAVLRIETQLSATANRAGWSRIRSAGGRCLRPNRPRLPSAARSFGSSSRAVSRSRPGRITSISTPETVAPSAGFGASRQRSSVDWKVGGIAMGPGAHDRKPR
jgi:hypothetical protein